MDNETVAPPGTVSLSTTVEPGAYNPSGGGAPNITEPADKPDVKPEVAAEKTLSIREALTAEKTRLDNEEAEAAKAKGDAAAKDAKAKADDAGKDEKAAKSRDDGGKFAKADEKGDTPDANAKADKGEPAKAATGQEGADKSRQSEGQKYHEPPVRFLPKAKEVWANVPHAVKGEIARMSQEHEAEVSKFRHAGERYESIRQFDELAKSNGRELKESLAKINEIEDTLKRSPIAGLEAILREVGPRKADGSHVSLYEVAQFIVQQTPQQFAQSVQPAQQAQTQQRQPDPEVVALKAEIQSMRTDQTVQSVIAPFAAQNPRFQELQEDIAFFLTSGKIPASLPPQERLEAAYDMAVRINPTSSVAPSQAREELADAKTAPSDDAGAKSVRGAPNGGEDPPEKRPAKSIRALLAEEMRSFRA